MPLEFTFSEEELDTATSATANPYLSDPRQGLQLIASLVARKRQIPATDSHHLLQIKLRELIHERFIELAAKGSYPGEARALRDLIALEKGLENLALFPDLANKTVVGVGGGFSAGKSRLLNTLLDIDLLPEALEPTTAIPTFITRGEESIVALNTFDQKIPLSRDALSAIAHPFTSQYRASLDESFSFAHVLKLIMLHHDNFTWSNLAFLDTPGYSKADAEHASATDQSIALRQLGEADHVIWLISAKNGTIRQDDLRFLRDLDHPKPIFFVITQSDLVGRSRIDAVLDSIADAIESAGIDCAGLMAWAAPLGEHQGERIAGDDIREWLGRLNDAPKYTEHRLTCERVLDGYIRHNQESLAANRKALALFNAMLSLQNRLPESEQSTLRQLLGEQRAQQKAITELVSEFGELKSDMVEIVAALVGTLAVDAPCAEELYAKGMARHEKGQYAQAATAFKVAAELGDSRAQFQFGIYHEMGLSIPVDEGQAADWYRRAANRGHAEAQFYLGVCLDNGVGVPLDAESAFAWYLKSAEQGYPEAQYNLAVCFADGEGVAEDDAQAQGWFEKAAKQGQPEAQFQILKRAAPEGSTAVRYALGKMYEQGNGTTKDLEKAVLYYKLAAGAGHATAQFEIGRRYQNGEGVRKNAAHAKFWLRKSAAQGNPGAISLLGYNPVTSRRSSLLGNFF